MDSRDASSSSSMAVVREGSPLVADDDGVLSATSLAKEATALFQARKYGECVDVLNQLLQKKEDDPKVLHNLGLAEFFQDGCSDPKKLLEVLMNVKKRCENLAHASGEQIDATSQPGNKAVSVPKGTNAMSNQIATADNASMAYNDEFDASLATLNMGIVLFFLHEYPKALSVLEPLFQNIEPIDERTALHVCLLLLDVALATQDVTKFADVINYLEKTLGVSYMINQADNGSAGQQQPPNLVSKSSLVPGNALASDDLSSDGAATGNTVEESLSRTLSDETIEYESLFSTLDIGGQNLSRPSNLSSTNDLRNPADRSFAAMDLRLKLPLYKVQLLLLTRSLKAAKREVKLAMNIARGRESSRALLLKSQLEYARGNYPKAMKLLAASNNQTEIGSSIIVNNNYGCIYYQQGKYHTSSIFFYKALNNCSALRKEKPRNFSSFSLDKSLLITYNCGVQYLASGKPILAARCFQRASVVFYDRPLLWLRLAECCLMAIEKGLLKSSATLPHGLEFRAHVIGQGKWRHLALENGAARNGHVNSGERDNLVSETVREPKLSMSFAQQCLLNALHLLNCSESKDVKSSLPLMSTAEESEPNDAALSKNLSQKISSGNDSKIGSKETVSTGQVNANGDIKEQRGMANVNNTAVNSISEYEDICRREDQMIKQAILVDLAFVELELANPLKALSAARSLLELPECSKMHAFLAHLYAAEALCLLNRLNEAADHLLIYLSGGNAVELPYTTQDCEQWQIKRTIDAEESNPGPLPASKPVPVEPQDVFLKPVEARGVLYINLATMLAMQGDLEQANRYATQALSTVPENQEAILVSVYLDLKRGNSEEALSKLKRCGHASFLASGVKLRSSC
ncbi:hypothetical protein Ancab_035157 [Ancistrocladus abbreviatus]